MEKIGVLIDVGKCIGCHACSTACKVKNDTPEGVMWTKVNTYELGTFPSAGEYSAPLGRCMHCEHPACVSACPVGALQKTERGPVNYDPETCIGCRYCMAACPFHVPQMDWNAVLSSIQKCQLCSDRLAAGLEPACASVCPTGALKFGDRSALLIEARGRIQSNGIRYLNQIYGEKEVGGTSTLYISPVRFAALGFPTLGNEPVTKLSETLAVYGTPAIAGVAIVALTGLSWFARRKAWVQAESTSARKSAE